jgi:hypothetical protein
MSTLAEFFSKLFLSEFSLSFLFGFFGGSLDEAPEMSLLKRTTLAWDFTLGFEGLVSVAALN